MRAPRSLQRAHLLMDFESTRNDHNRDMRQQFFQFRQVIEAKITFIQNMIENDRTRRLLCCHSQRIGAGPDPHQFVVGECVFI
jgi:hypothetical protein